MMGRKTRGTNIFEKVCQKRVINDISNLLLQDLKDKENTHIQHQAYSY